MHKYSTHSLAAIWYTSAMLLAFFITPAQADDAVNKDLTSVLALLGLPCGQVVSAVAKSDNDHAVVCKDGNRYRVFLNPEGRVVATKL